MKGSVRSHSGRHTMINQLKEAGLPDDINMMYARICDRQTYAGYGVFSEDQAAHVLHKSKKLRAAVATIYQKLGGLPSLASKKKNTSTAMKLKRRQ